MKATVEYAQEKFREFNRLIFGGSLPEIPVVPSKARAYVGVCRYKKRRKGLSGWEAYDFRLGINTTMDLPEAEIEDTIIHEMIHYYIGLNRIKDTSTHGKVFRQMMAGINEKFGRHITISHKRTGEEAIDTRLRWHVVAVVSFADGRTGIKVVPRIAQRILSYRRGVLSAPGVTGVEFFLTNDPFFNRYPNSASLKVYFLERSLVDSHLTDARRLSVTATRVQ